VRKRSRKVSVESFTTPQRSVTPGSLNIEFGEDRFPLIVFGEQIDAGLCYPDPCTPPDGPYGWWQLYVNPVIEPDDGSYDSFGFPDMGVGSVWRARVKVNFKVNTGAKNWLKRAPMWTLRFRESLWPLSTNVLVERLPDLADGTQRWEVRAEYPCADNPDEACDLATLVFENTDDYGTYVMPFRLLVERKF
jgi:hypothetical protein